MLKLFLFNIPSQKSDRRQESMSIQHTALLQLETNSKDQSSVSQGENVSLHKLSLKEILEKSLNIPDYQRIYCWSEKNVVQLLKDIADSNREYRLGTIILQNKDGKYDIIDGQQRLITLSLILLKLNDDTSPLLDCTIDNTEAIKYIEYNKWVIHSHIERYREKYVVDTLKDNLTFNVLILNNDSRELAYTFFSNENSKGQALSDFDLLKAHHLRYVYDDSQATHLAQSWDKLLLKGNEEENVSERDYVRALSLYIFRLRKWLNYDLWDENEKLRIKREYEAAATIPQIPAFGEQFFYGEPIQGGSHFFAYVSHFINHFNTFKQTNQYQSLHKYLVDETHIWFRDVIEAILFAYFIKFGDSYLNDALVLITRITSQIRYDVSRIYQIAIFNYINNSKVVMMINRATSPTFCLAEMEMYIDTLTDFEGDKNKEGKTVKRIRSRYCKRLGLMIQELESKKERFVINHNTIATWKQYIN